MTAANIIGDGHTTTTEIHEQDNEWQVIVKLHPHFESWVGSLHDEIKYLKKRVRKLEGWHESES